MDNRFGFKDFMLLGMMFLLLLLFGLARWQDGRQWEKLADVNTKLEQQNTQLERIGDLLERGVRVSGDGTTLGGGGEALTDANDPFYRVRDLPGREDYATGDFYIDCFGATVKNLTPLVAGDVYADRIDDHVLETLARRDTEVITPYYSLRFTPPGPGTYTADLLQ